jgi:hypothetical protein
MHLIGFTVEVCFILFYRVCYKQLPFQKRLISEIRSKCAPQIARHCYHC